MVESPTSHLPELFKNSREFPDSPGVKNLSCNAGDEGSIPGQGTVSHATESPSTCAVN